MLQYIKKTLKTDLGVDRSILWAVINKAFGFVKGPLSLYFFIRFLSPQELGLWYTFGSLGALTIFAELGFTSIITQFVSHEYAKLKNKEALGSGDMLEMDKLLGLIRFSIKVYFIIIPIAILILTIAGYLYFKSESIEIIIAWCIFSLAGGIGLLLGLLQSIYQGLDRVKEIQINIFLSSAILAVFNWGMLALNFKIWALVIGNFTGILISSFLLFQVNPKFWKLVIHYKPVNQYAFLKETLPLQWRYAISWVSSYFITYLYVPATYKLVGPEQAGQLGMTITILTAIVGIANNWVFTKVPKFNMLVSLKDYLSLNKLFRRSTFQGLLVLLFFSSLFILGLALMQSLLPSVSKRFLSVGLTFLFLLPQIAQYIVGSLATYLRAHKEEPFIWLSVASAALMIGAVFGVLKQNLELKILFYCLNIIYWIIILPLAVRIYNNKKKIFLIKYYNF